MLDTAFEVGSVSQQRRADMTSVERIRWILVGERSSRNADVVALLGISFGRHGSMATMQSCEATRRASGV